MEDSRDDDSCEETIGKEVVRMIRNDTVRPKLVNIVMPTVEKIHFETTYQTNRLNEEIDIHNIDIRRLMSLIDESEENMTPLTTAVIRSFQTHNIGVRIQLDSGANRSITQHRHLLHNIKPIRPISLDGVGGNIVAKEVGYIKIECDDDSYIWAKTMYCPQSPETIISPNDIAMSSQNNFTAWSQYSDVVTGLGHITFYTKSGLGTATLPLHMKNGLWYNSQKLADLQDYSRSRRRSIIRHLNATAEYELWHQRLGHAGEKAMSVIHNCVDGVPSLYSHRNKFHKCECCMRGKVTSAAKRKYTNVKTSKRGEIFHMDFGFVRGSEYKSVNDKGKIVTSRDGYNSYLIIVDAHTRYSWVFLSASKHPPLKIVTQFLQRYGLTEGTFRQVRCDQGGELAKSSKFREVIQNEGYSIEPTGSDNSSQNGVAERPNRTYGDMMRSMLINAGLSSKFWSYALIQAVFVKNRLPHSHHNFTKTPFEALTGRRPNLQHLKIFGSRIIAKNTGQRRAKLDHHTSSGIFLHHTASTSISK